MSMMPSVSARSPSWVNGPEPSVSSTWPPAAAMLIAGEATRSGGGRAAPSPVGAHPDQVTVTGVERASQGHRSAEAARGGAVRDVRAQEVDRVVGRVEQLDEVGVVDGAGVASGAVDLADDQVGAGRVGLAAGGARTVTPATTTAALARAARRLGDVDMRFLRLGLQELMEERRTSPADGRGCVTLTAG